MAGSVSAQAPLPGTSTNTLGVLSATAAAAPSCFSYRVTGVCFFLRCTPFGCSVETSIRVSHYMPDVLVSTYNDQYIHPWRDVGGVVSGIGDRIGAAILRSPVDASANTSAKKRGAAEPVTMKTVDAIGNPAVLINNSGNQLVVPGISELMSFPSTLPEILREWAVAPVGLMQQAGEGVVNLLTNPGALMNTVTGVGNLMGGMGPDMSSMGPAASGGMDAASQSGFQEQLGQLGGMLTGAADAGGGGDMLCPSSADAFGVYFQSDVDSLFWRSMIPLELLYVGSWLPGYNEVSHLPLVNTWGSVYPRTGELVQQHPVKASAVLAERVSRIIRRPSQPHIYAHLRPKSSGSFVWFAQVADPRWSMVHPYPSGCHTFGANDSVALIGYGDYRNTPNNSHVWNLWTRYECCRRRTEIYLFAVP
jgi:hypothetical protein